MNYSELTIQWDEDAGVSSEIIIAQLSEAGFDGFIEEDRKVIAYIDSEKYADNLLLNCAFFKHSQGKLNFEVKVLADTNWNALWESNFEPVFINNCIIRAPFHQLPQNIEYDIVIEPKMSFGTGHHETTALVVEAMLKINFENLKVLDMGCGTGVLAILAAMRKASLIDAVDNDEWSYKNSIENIQRNNYPDINVYLGDIQTVKNNKYDIIIANITRNILIEFIPYFSKMQSGSGKLILSGFFISDIDTLKSFAEVHQYKLKNTFSKNNWAALELYRVD